MTSPEFTEFAQFISEHMFVAFCLYYVVYLLFLCAMLGCTILCHELNFIYGLQVQQCQEWTV